MAPTFDDINRLARQFWERDPSLSQQQALVRAADALLADSDPRTWQEVKQASARAFSQPPAPASPPPVTHQHQAMAVIAERALGFAEGRTPQQAVVAALDADDGRLYALYQEGVRLDRAGVAVVPPQPTRRTLSEPLPSERGGASVLRTDSLGLPVHRPAAVRPAGNASRVAAKLSAAFSERRIPGAADLASVLVDAATGRA
jgi:hypothetical protein